MMTPATRHSELHVYIDESGTLHGKLDGTQLLQVGGVLVLGPSPEAELIDLLRQSVAATGGSFPADLHTRPGNGHLRQRIVHEVARRLAARADHGEPLLGVAIRHAQDLAPEGGLLTGEPRADNRYQRMLIDLLQHLLFVAPALRERLTPDAEVFLHLASRKVIFAPGQATRAQLEAMGHRVHDHDDPPGSLRVGLTLEAKELIALLRGTLQQTWPQCTLRLPALPWVGPIHYEPGQSLSPAGLYLADLFLFQGRNRVREEGGLLATPGLFATEIIAAYGPALERQVQRSAALARGDVERYLVLCREPDGLAGPASTDADAVGSAQERQAAALMAEQNVTPQSLAEYAARVVDLPGRAAEGRELAERARRLGALLPLDEPRTDLAALQALISAANHTGHVEEARRLWNEYGAVEASLGTSLELQHFVGAMRGRWAVSLTDQWRLAEARQVLESFIPRHEEALAQLAQALGRPGLVPPIPELGALYGTLGQVYAFSERAGDSARAEGAFRHAIKLEAGDAAGCERQWVYLGHLACDRGEAGRPLWQEVMAHLPDVGGVAPVVEEGGPYRLALQLKGQVRFGTPASRQTFLSTWDATDPPAQYADELRQQHPFGLIYQAAGLVRTQAWRESAAREQAQRALDDFDRAAAHMEGQGPLLQVLALVARLRRGLFELEVFGPTAARRDTLAAQVGALCGLAKRALGPATLLAAHDPGEQTSPEERARGLLAAIRFNYW